MAGVSGGCSRLAKYTVKKSVGKGSYGEVFLVTHKEDGKQYVMKNIKLTASSAKERQAAEQEASLLSRLKHPNIVSYKESFQDRECLLHIVMGYCEGGDLSSRLQSYHGNLLPEGQVVEWFVQIALALQYLHDRNILHRDLKTQNIFLSKNDIIKVGDLGIARVLDGSCDLAQTVVGTPYYMSPELFSNQPYNHKSDVWALGCCLYEIATLKHAFSARNINALMVKIVQGQVPALPGQFTTELSDIVKSMLSRNATCRPSVHQLLRMEYIRTHIKLFLDRASNKKRKTSRQKEQQSPAPPPVTQRESARKPPSPPSGLSLARERRRQHRLQEMKAGLRGEMKAGLRGENACVVRAACEPLNNISNSDSSSPNTHHKCPPPCDRQQGERRQPLTHQAVKQPATECAVEEKRDCGEVEEFYTLLDSTLHNESEAGAVAEGVWRGGGGEPGGEVASLQPGRLQERIAALRRECEAGLGKDMVNRALSLLDHLDPDPDMQVLLPLLGEDGHGLYAPKLRQLGLCEDALLDK